MDDLLCSQPAMSTIYIQLEPVQVYGCNVCETVMERQTAWDLPTEHPNKAVGQRWLGQEIARREKENWSKIYMAADADAVTTAVHGNYVVYFTVSHTIISNLLD